MISCTSKVLIMGGYAILDSKNIGISIGTNIRFFSNVKAETGKV
jgi:phosphomevalonate kinase